MMNSDLGSVSQITVSSPIFWSWCFIKAIGTLIKTSWYQEWGISVDRHDHVVLGSVGRTWNSGLEKPWRVESSMKCWVGA